MNKKMTVNNTLSDVDYQALMELTRLLKPFNAIKPRFMRQATGVSFTDNVRANVVLDHVIICTGENLKVYSAYEYLITILVPTLIGDVNAFFKSSFRDGVKDFEMMLKALIIDNIVMSTRVNPYQFVLEKTKEFISMKEREERIAKAKETPVSQNTQNVPITVE